MSDCKAKDIWSDKNKAKGISEANNSQSYVETNAGIK